MNIWDLSSLRTNELNLQLDPIAYVGNNAWEKYKENYNFYFIEYDEVIESNILIFGLLRQKNLQKYNSWYSHLSFSEYSLHSESMYNILMKFNLELIKYRNNPVMKKYFQFLNDLIYDIYNNGRFSYPTMTFTEPTLGKITIHPGQNLFWVSKFLGLPRLSWISMKKEYEDVFLKYYQNHVKIIKNIKDEKDIFDIYLKYSNLVLNKNIINAYIQEEMDYERPFLAPLLPVEGRQIFGSIGNSDSPWDRIKKWNIIINDKSWIKMIDEEKYHNLTLLVKIKKEIKKDLLYNRLYAFLITGQNENEEFLLK